MTLSSMQLQLLHRAGNRFRDDQVKALHDIEHAANTDNAGQLCRYTPRFEPGYRALRDSGLLGQFGLGKVSIQTDPSQPSSEFSQDSVVCSLFCYFHNTPFMAY